MVKSQGLFSVETWKGAGSRPAAGAIVEQKQVTLIQAR